MDTETVFERHLIDLGRQAESRSMYTFSGFMGLAEQDRFHKLSGELGFIDHSLYGGSDSAERAIAVFGSEAAFGYPPDYPIRVLSIWPLSEKYGEELSHRDYLGALLNLGLDRSVIGDIVIREKKAWVYVLESAAAFISENLTRVRHTDVGCEILEPGDIPELKPVLTELRFNIASERMDSVVAGLTKVSRSQVSEFFTRGYVTLNGQIVTSVSKTPKPGDVITVRGYGKAIYDGVSGHSKKDRLYVTLRKYV